MKYLFILQLRRLLETAAWMVGKSLIEVVIDRNAHGFFFSTLRHQDQAEPLEIRPVVFFSRLTAGVALHLSSCEPEVLLIKNTF